MRSRLSLIPLGLAVLAFRSASADPLAYNFTIIDVPGATYTDSYGVNNAGAVVGGSELGGFLDAHGVFTPLHGLGDTPAYAYGINDADQIVTGTGVGRSLSTLTVRLQPFRPRAAY